MNATTPRPDAPADDRGRVRPFAIMLAAAFLGLAALIAASPRFFMYDEELHLRGAYLLAGVDDTAPESGRSLAPIGIRQLLHTPLPSAPGPLYPIVHAALYPLTRLEVPQIRFVNVCFLALGGAALAFALSRWHGANAWPLAGMLLAVPMTWDAAGLAHTEMPALALASCALAAVAWATTLPAEKRLCCYVGFGAAGMFAGGAILGRQTYLPAIAALAAIAWSSRPWRGPALVGFALSVLIPLPVFVAWGGLVNPEQKPIGGGFSFAHGLIGLAFLALTLALIAPRFFLQRWRWSLAAAATGALLSLTGLRLGWTAYEGLFAALPRVVGPSYSVAISAAVFAAGAALAVSVAVHLWERRHDRRFAVALGITLLLTATAFGIVHQYTPRYAMSAFPFVVLVAQPFFTLSPWLLPRFAAGCTFGALSLSYCYSHS